MPNTRSNDTPMLQIIYSEIGPTVRFRFGAVILHCGVSGFNYYLPSHMSKGFHTVQYTNLSVRRFVSLIVPPLYAAAVDHAPEELLIPYN